ncbi:MAG: radical SAM protein [Candidatus Rifleibacteriota bacterium]
MTAFAIKRLLSGGLITNYQCSSRCQHCLYACSPQRKNDYISETDAFNYLSLIKAMGCNSVHIGGGEPFLHPEKLLAVVKAANRANVKIEYIETNSSWFTDARKAENMLTTFRNAGVKSLLISISPFHAEFVPLAKVKGVLQACQKTGINVFPWVKEFYPELARFDPNEIVNIADLEQIFGENYRQSIPQRYWLQPNGRAVNFLQTVYSMQSAVDLASDRRPCNELFQTSHFHIDLYGNYVPGLCAGISIRCRDLGQRLSEVDYPLFNALANKGISGLVEIAAAQSYTMSHEYLNKCHLCQDIRRYLLREKGMDTHELQPREFYAFI